MNVFDVGMPAKQEYILLQCHSCGTYQVHIDKKSRIFVCSLCHCKQPFSRIFARSTKASDCRKLCSSYNKVPPDSRTLVTQLVQDPDRDHHDAHPAEIRDCSAVVVEKECTDGAVIPQESSFSGWDAYLSDDDGAPSAHPRRFLEHDDDIDRKPESSSRWKEEERVVCSRQPRKKKQRMDQMQVALTSNKDAAKQPLGDVTLHRHPSQHGGMCRQGTGGQTWFEEFLD